MKTLAIIISKITSKVGSWLGRGSALPGKLALDIHPNILSDLKTPNNLSIISGTNGKTTTAHFISAIERSSGNDVIHNAMGANMPQGILSVLLDRSDLSGKVRADSVVLEVDEGFLGLISSRLKGEYLVFTNLFDDQIDRFGSAKDLADRLISAVNPNYKLIINGNDPTLVYLANNLKNSHIKYYGSLEGCESNLKKDIRCPNCKNALKYSKIIYDNLGVFSCDCGLKTPEIDYILEEVDYANKSFKVNAYTYKSRYDTDYMVFNTLAAISYGLERGFSEDTINQGISTYEVGLGRMERIIYNGRETFLNLVKNKAGLDRSLEYIKDKADEPYYLFFSANNRPADGEDFFWIAESDFSLILGEKLQGICLTGEIKEEVKNILIDKGFQPDMIKNFNSNKEALDCVNGKGMVYFLSNYTAMSDLKNSLL